MYLPPNLVQYAIFVAVGLIAVWSESCYKIQIVLKIVHYQYYEKNIKDKF